MRKVLIENACQCSIEGHEIRSGVVAVGSNIVRRSSRIFRPGVDDRKLETSRRKIAG